VLHRVTVTGSRGGLYEVAILENGKTRCECHGFRYRQECRHVQAPEVQDLVRNLAPARRSADEVAMLAGWLVAALRPYVAQIEVVGSLRRGRTDVKDIDLLFLPGAYSAEQVIALFRSFGKPVHLGEMMGAIVLPQGVPAQLWPCEEPAVWGAALLHFIGPRDYNIALRIRANRRGWQLSQHGLTDRQTGRLLAGATEEEVCKALDMPWLPPTMREKHRRVNAGNIGSPDPGWR
jgi:DNA polymerase/3'-5' exonuclease PolX